MNSDFDQWFYDFISNRNMKIGNIYVSTNQEYINLNKKSLEYYAQIESYLPEEAKHLLFELDESLSQQQGMIEDHMYLQGIKDGFKLYCLLTES